MIQPETTDTDTDEDDADSDTVRACPECDSTALGPRTGRPGGPTSNGPGAYRCNRCGATFDDPVDREPHDPQAETGDGLPVGLDPEVKAQIRALKDGGGA